MTTNDKVYAFMQTIVAERCLAGFIHGHTAEDLLDEMTAERVPPLPTSDTSVSKPYAQGFGAMVDTFASLGNLQAQAAAAGGNLSENATVQSATGQQGANLGSQADGQLSSVLPEPPKAA